jgi:hypothetical protein
VTRVEALPTAEDAGWMVAVDDGRPVLTFSVTHKRSWPMTLLSLVTLDSGGDWTTGVWKVWATTADGRQFMLKSAGSDSYARQVIQAYIAQLADVDVAEWARSKGFSQLAAHVERLRAA